MLQYLLGPSVICSYNLVKVYAVHFTVSSTWRTGCIEQVGFLWSGKHSRPELSFPLKEKKNLLKTATELNLFEVGFFVVSLTHNSSCKWQLVIVYLNWGKSCLLCSELRVNWSLRESLIRGNIGSPALASLIGEKILDSLIRLLMMDFFWLINKLNE